MGMGLVSRSDRVDTGEETGSRLTILQCKIFEIIAEAPIDVVICRITPLAFECAVGGQLCGNTTPNPTPTVSVG